MLASVAGGGRPRLRAASAASLAFCPCHFLTQRAPGHGAPGLPRWRGGLIPQRTRAIFKRASPKSQRRCQFPLEDNPAAKLERRMLLAERGGLACG